MTTQATNLQKLPSQLAPDAETWESPDGVDLSLIYWSLGLTPTQRLEVLEDFVGTAEALRRGRRP